MPASHIRKTHAPGKLILSGEHAVVHGAPALAMAVDKGVQAEWTPARIGDPVAFRFGDHARWEISPSDLHGFRSAAAERLEAFRKGTLSANDILARDEDLLTLAVACANPGRGGQITLASDLPTGAGLGSSAALVLAILHAIRDDWETERLLQTALNCEHHQHGTSSGLDLQTSFSGGIVQFEQGTFSSVDAYAPALRLFDSGRPLSSTGECVSAVRAAFEDETVLWNDFAAVTHDMRAALHSGDREHLQDCVRANHRLLNHIGVVPASIDRLISQIERSGGAAKLCGAGAVRGEAAGMLMVVGDVDLAALATDIPLRPVSLSMDPLGLRVLQHSP